MREKKNSASAATAFCEWIQLEIYVYIPHCKDQVKPHSSSWFAAACPAAIAQKSRKLFSIHRDLPKQF